MANIQPPSRIQRRRSKGWRKPPGVVFVGRPTKWGNPYIVGQHVSTNAEAVAMYEKWLTTNPTLMNDLHELSDKTLMCWCAVGKPCHADVLLRLLSQPTRTPPDGNAGCVVASLTHELAADVSEQGHEVERRKSPLSGAGEQGRANNRTRQVLSGPAGEGSGLQLPAKPCETFLT